MNKHIIRQFIYILLLSFVTHAQVGINSEIKHPIILDGDTLFTISSGIGIFTAEKRAAEINAALTKIARNDSISVDSIKVLNKGDHLLLAVGDQVIMGLYSFDAQDSTKPLTLLAQEYSKDILAKIKTERESYSKETLIKNGIFTLVYIISLILGLWLLSFLFPKLSKLIGSLDQSLSDRIVVKGKKLLKHEYLIKSLVVASTGLRFAITLFLIYLFFVKTSELWPFIHNLKIQPIIKSVALFIFYSAIAFSFIKGINASVLFLAKKYKEWEGTKIKSVKVRSFELLSAERSVEILLFFTKVLRFVLFGILFYLYITIVFSLFSFTETWADTLLTYILDPLTVAIKSFLSFLPNLFFIVVLSFVFSYLIKFVKFIFNEIDRGTLELPGFYKEWAKPTYKIVRFLILILAAIVIFPYLPGSDSPFFQGISVFLGILFSLGSSSAIANMVSGIVITYMRPFKLGDRVKIAETIGEVIEKNLLVTRVRTVKNVDITIPNAMVLGSHIINFSSSAVEKGLILHTTVTIGYDVPWNKVHQLLISACLTSEYILKDPKPFVLQTSLDDFYVSYEVNAYTHHPEYMAAIYSQIHSAIQDKFNEAGVEIMSPHYSAVRDGNSTTIPQDYLPKDYKAPGFNIFGQNIFGNKGKDSSEKIFEK